MPGRLPRTSSSRSIMESRSTSLWSAILECAAGESGPADVEGGRVGGRRDQTGSQEEEVAVGSSDERRPICQYDALREPIQMKVRL